MSNWSIKEKSTGELQVSVSGERWVNAQEAAFKKLAKDVEIDGFRKGQAPKSLVKQRVSDALVQSEAIESIANELLQEGIQEHDLWPVARPELKINSISNESVDVTFVVTVKPEVTLGEYKGLKFEVEPVAVSEDEINTEIERLQSQYSEVVNKEGAAEDGDTVVIDFEGFKDGVAFEGGKAEGHELKLGSNSFIPGFESQVVGMAAGESKDINVSFPEDYHVDDLKGAPVVFKVTVHEVRSTVLPELNDSFAQDLNIPEVETLEQLKEKIKSQNEAQKQKNNENMATEKLMDEVVDNASVDIPDQMIEDETNQMIQEFAQNLQMQNFGFDQFLKATNQKIEDLKSQMKGDAERRVKMRLVLEAVAKNEGLEVSEEEVTKELEDIASQYQMELEKVKSLIPAESLQYDLKVRKALDLIKDSAVK